MRPAVLAACISAAAAPLLAQDAPTALHRAEEAYRSLETLSAEFTQTLVNPMLGEPEESRGLLFLAPPSRFAMRFTRPEGERLVADGSWLWIYAPSSAPNQVIKQPIPQSGISSPNLMGQFVDRPLERYEARYVRQETLDGQAVDVVALTPRSEGLGFRSAEITVARSDGILRGIAVVEESGQRRTLVFRRIRTDTPIPAGELRFRVKPGMRVVVPGT